MVRRCVASAALVVAVGGTAHADRRELTFQEAIAITLAHNGELYLAQTDTEIAADDLALARSVFAPRLIGNLRVARENQPGNATRFAWRELSASGSLELAGRIPTGLTYSLGLGTLADRFSSPFLTIYDPAYTTGLTLSLTQPLLRGAWRSANEQPIVVAALRRDLTEQQLRARLEQIAGEVEVAYWTLALAFKEHEARESSLKLAQDQLAESTRLVRLGTISNLDVLDARAGVGRAQQELIRAQQQIADAEGQLRGVIIGPPAWKPDDILVPVDPADAAHVSLSVDDHLALARRNRPDVVAAAAALKVERAGLAVTQNGLLPALDLVASGGVVGFAGQLDRNYATSGVAGLDGSLIPPYVPDRDVEGGMGRAFENLATSGNYTVSLGLRLELPIDNSAARARHARQHHAMVRAEIAERSVLAQVDNEVRRSLALLHGNEALEAAADEAVTVNEQLLAGMRKRFSAGAVTSFDVLRVADELTRAQINAARARVSYRISLARLATADGTLLDQLHITLSSLHRPH
jgi:outer membrane protein TolC